MTFYRTLHQESWGVAVRLRAMCWYDFRRGKKWGMMVNRPAELTLRQAAELFLRRLIQFSTVNISDETLARFARRLRVTGTRLLAGDPVPLHLLARFVEKQGADLRLDAAVSFQETLHPDVRADIEAAFGCGLFDLYGAMEMGVMAAQCPGCGRYVVSDEMVHVELNEQEGDASDVIVTSLVNHGMPLLRYAIGDSASGIRNGCDCGRAHTTLSSVEGRTLGLIARRGGAERRCSRQGNDSP